MSTELYGQLNTYMNEVVNTIMQDQVLLKFLYYNTHDDVLSMPDLTVEQKKSMLGDTVFKYKKVPVRNDLEMKTYLAIEYGEIDRMQQVSYREVNPYFFRPTIDIFIISTDNNVETHNGNRVYAIESRLAELFHFRTHGTTMGKSRITKSDSIYGLPLPFHGREINVEFWDINPQEESNSVMPKKFERPVLKINGIN